MVTVSDELVGWLAEEIERRGWSMRELARRAGLSHATVSQVLSGQQAPTWGFCAAIAGPLDEPVDELFIRAGLKRRPPAPVQEEHEVVAIVRGLPADVRAWLMVMLRGLAGGDPMVPVRVEEEETAYTVRRQDDELVRQLLAAFEQVPDEWKAVAIAQVAQFRRSELGRE